MTMGCFIKGYYLKNAIKKDLRVIGGFLCVEGYCIDCAHLKDISALLF